MELTLTQQQRQYLHNKGVISPDSLQKAYKESVKEQRSIKKAAEKIRSKKSSEQ